jgi:hypothetical protein
LLTARTYRKLQQIAQRKGLPLTKLVASWLKETERSQLLTGQTHPQSRSAVLELRLEAGEVYRLEGLAYSLGVTLSRTIARIIEHNLLMQSAVTTLSEQIEAEWQIGRYRNLSAGALNKLELLDFQSIYTLIRINIEAGYFTVAKDLIQYFDRLLNSDTRSLKYQALLYICKSRVARVDKDLEGTKSNALEALRLGETLEDDHIIGLAHFRLGIFELGGQNMQESLSCFEKAAAHLPVRQDPFIFLQIYLMKALAAAAKFDSAQYELYITLSAELLARYPNAYFQAYYNSIVLQKKYLYQEPEVFAQSLENIELAKSSGSLLMAYDAYEFSGMVGTTFNEEYSAVSNKLINAFGLETKFRPETDTSNVKLFHLVNSARQNYDQVSTSLRKSRLAITSNGLEPEFYSYLFSAVDYIYAPDQQLKQASHKQLHTLQQSTQSPHLQSAVLHTLNKRELAPVIL